MRQEERSCRPVRRSTPVPTRLPRLSISLRGRCSTCWPSSTRCFGAGGVSSAKAGLTPPSAERRSGRQVDGALGCHALRRRGVGWVLTHHDLAGQQGANLGLAEPAVPPWRTDAAYPTGRRPPGDRLGVNPEKVGDFARRKQPFACLHQTPSYPDLSRGVVSLCDRLASIR